MIFKVTEIPWKQIFSSGEKIALINYPCKEEFEVLQVLGDFDFSISCQNFTFSEGAKRCNYCYPIMYAEGCSIAIC